MRAIGRRAQVDPALIVHYFGSKDGLLREALTLPLDPAAVLSEALAGVPADRVGQELVRRVVQVWDSPEMTPLLLSLLRTAVSHDLAMTYLRDMLQRTVIAAVSCLVGEDDAQRRAELVAAQMWGVAVTRYLLRLPALAAMTPDDLARTVGPSVQQYLAGEA
jgi:AcrR family transcriptional regulator